MFSCFLAAQFEIVIVCALDIRMCSTAKTQHEKNMKQIFPEKELHDISHNFHIYMSVSDLYIPAIGPHIFLQQKTGRSWEYMYV
jgi:hypothetical protein